MAMELLSVLAEWAASHMPNFIVRLAFPDEKIMERVRISQRGASVAGIYIPPESPVIRMTLQIRNSLPFSIELRSLHGDVQADEYYLIHNFTSLLNETLKGHFDKDFSITLDLPDSQAKIVGNHIADNFGFSLNGELVFNALGRTLTKPTKVGVIAVIHGFHGNRN
jgi:hypothetical protein